MNRKIKKAFKFRIYPNSNSEKHLNFILECCRWEYNLALSIKETSFKLTETSPSQFELSGKLSSFIKLNPNLNKVYSQVRQEVLARVEKGYKIFFKGIKDKRKVGKPKFQYDKNYNSFTYKQNHGFEIYDENSKGIKANGNWKWVKLSLAKKEYFWVKMKQHRDIKGKIKTLTIKKNYLNQWFAIFISEIEVKVLPETKPIGIDLGIKTLAHLSDDTKVENPMNFDSFKNINKRIVATQQKLQETRDKINSCKKKKEKKKLWKKYNKQLLELRRSWNKYNNMKNDYLQKESTKILKKHNVVCIEDFKPKKLSEKSSGNEKSLRRRLRQASCTSFKSMIEAKSFIRGRHSILVPPENTTKTCSNCFNIRNIDLEERVYKCEYCSIEIDRDLNAAKNIERMGLKLLKAA